MNNSKRFYYWQKLQRRYRRMQQRWMDTQDNHLAKKLDMLRRRMHRINRKWRLGISTTALVAWLMLLPGGEAQAQQFDVGSLPHVSFEGENNLDYFGIAVSGAGDINNDGFPDLVVGGEESSSTSLYQGAVYVIFGDGEGFANAPLLSELDGTNGFKVVGENAYDALGHAVSSAGDINGDGVDDLFLGARKANTAYVIFGTGEASGFPAQLDLFTLDGSNGFRINGENVGDRFGSAISSSGDINGDGVNDLLIGAAGADNPGGGSGKAYIVFGNAAGVFEPVLNASELDGENGFRINPRGLEDYNLGSAVSIVEDINGDGNADLLIGAYAASGSISGGESGVAYVVFGNPEEGFGSALEVSGLDGTNGFRINGENIGDFFGSSVSSAGDVNGDGLADLMIGANRASPSGDNSGSAYVVFGKPSQEAFEPELNAADLDGTNGFRIDGEEQFAQLGGAVSSAGDVNGDGLDDLLIGTARANTAYVVFGRRDNEVFEPVLNVSDLDGRNGFLINGENDLDRFGYAVSAVGDINGDGLDDTLVGAYLRNGNFNATGAAYLVFGVNPSIPFIANELPDANATENESFTYEIPTNTFANLLEETDFTVGVTLLDGSPLPGWLSFDAGLGTLSGTPGNEDTGVLTVEVTATESGGQSISDAFELTVSDVNGTPLVRLPIENQATTEGQAFTLTLPVGTFTDPDGDELVLSAFLADDSALPGWLSFDPDTGTFSGTPENEDIGTLEIKVTATDLDNLSVSEFFTLAVRGIPVVSNALPDATGTEDTPFDYIIPENTFIDPEGAALTLTASLADDSALPGWLLFDPATGTFSGTPNGEDVGTLEIKVRATDPDGLRVSDTFTLTIIEVNDSPELDPINDQAVNEGEELSLTASASDEEGDVLTFSLDATSTNKGMTIGASTGVFSWTPDPSDEGPHEVTITVSDGNSTDTETFTITVATPLGLGDLGEAITVYPNPANGEVHFEGLTGRHQAVVYSLSGVYVMDGEITEGVLDISQLEVGSYIITMSKEGKVLFHTRILKIN